MHTFEVVFSDSSTPTRCGGGAMRVDAATPADAVDAVKRARGNVNIISVSAVRCPSVNYAEDSVVAEGSQ